MISDSQYTKLILGNRPWTILALMRFAFALWVLFAHTYNFGAVGYKVPVPSENALVAVYCFLAISGFSIHHSIITQQNGFLVRRFWRIAPIQICSLALAGLVYLVCGTVIKDGFGNLPPFPSFDRWMGCALLLQAIFPVYIDVLFPSWSLSIEIIYYLFTPLLFRLGKITCALLFIVTGIFCIYRPELSSLYIGLNTHGISIAALFWAYIAGWLAYRYPRNFLYFMLSIGIGCICIYVDPLLKGWFNYFAWVCTITLQFWIVKAVNLGTFCDRLLQYLGELSFPLYLLHYPILFLLLNSIFVRFPSWNTTLIEVSIIFMVAVFVTSFIDLPLRRRIRART